MPQQTQRELYGLAAWRKKGDTTAVSEVLGMDEYTYWCEKVAPTPACEDPVSYWIGLQDTYPRLARMALGIFWVPAMSDEPERIFSSVGCMVTDRRNCLMADVVQASQCVRSWESSGLISIM